MVRILQLIMCLYVLLSRGLPDNLDGDVEDVEVEGVIGDLPPLRDAHDGDEDGQERERRHEQLPPYACYPFLVVLICSHLLVTVVFHW